MNTRKLVRRTAGLMTMFIINKNKRKETRQKVEDSLHKLFKTEYGQCSQIFEQHYLQNKQIGWDKYHLISLGDNCFGRMVFSWWGLKPRKTDGEKTMPFDISVHPLSTVSELLETHFKTYFDHIEFDEKGGRWTNPQKNIVFVHDKENDKTAFIEKYRHRIEALDEAIADKKPCVFFAYHDGETKVGEINRLYTILEKLCSHKPFKLIYMVFNAPFPQGANPAVATYQADFPKKYRHMDKFTKYTKGGLSFELGVTEFTRQQIQDFLQANKKASD